MRSTCLGARSGRSAMTTRPLVVSRIRVFSGSLAAGMRALLGENHELARVYQHAPARSTLSHARARRPGSLLEVDLLHGVGDRRRLARRDLVDVVHAFGHLAPHRV